MAKFPFPLAAPSCVLPSHIVENAEFLAHKVEEVGLYFMQSEPCLKYDEKDVPLHLAALPLRWHVHLPVDLPWQKKGSGAAKIAFQVLQKALFLRPRYAVLHPPTHASVAVHEQLLQDFAKTWFSLCSVPVLLENIKHAPLVDLDPKLFMGAKNLKRQAKNTSGLGRFGVCLDVAHMLAFQQESIAQCPHLLRLVQLVHWSAPGGADKHLALQYLSKDESASVQKVISLLPSTATHILEIFSWEGIEASVDVWKKFMENCR